ncbi:hypothetical protein POM88_001560 [Heracleum sosnowskyi]|uniref:Uncharacterized protein n=1 Tax=Heracleum sosnowskyi TaxID=360622 RepID=A0AAD8N534_9APIA|nr:hypothetical protein POM88_001560 [Heracleum sosnowskyi]
MAEEEANALSVRAVACLCGSLRLEHVLTFFAGALLEKQIVVCSNLMLFAYLFICLSDQGILSAAVLSVIPLIRPYLWQSLLMPVADQNDRNRKRVLSEEGKAKKKARIHILIISSLFSRHAEERKKERKKQAKKNREVGVERLKLPPVSKTKPEWMM